MKKLWEFLKAVWFWLGDVLLMLILLVGSVVVLYECVFISFDAIYRLSLEGGLAEDKALGFAIIVQVAFVMSATVSIFKHMRGHRVPWVVYVAGIAGLAVDMWANVVHGKGATGVIIGISVPVFAMLSEAVFAAATIKMRAAIDLVQEEKPVPPTDGTPKRNLWDTVQDLYGTARTKLTSIKNVPDNDVPDNDVPSVPVPDTNVPDTVPVNSVPSTSVPDKPVHVPDKKPVQLKSVPSKTSNNRTKDKGAPIKPFVPKGDVPTEEEVMLWAVNYYYKTGGANGGTILGRTTLEKETKCAQRIARKVVKALKERFGTADTNVPDKKVATA